MAQCPHLINGKCGVTGNFLEPERIRKICDKEWSWNKNYFRCGYFFEELWNQHVILDLRTENAKQKFSNLARLNSKETLDLLKTAYGGQIERCENCKQNVPKLCHFHEFLLQKTVFLLQQVNGFSSVTPINFGMREHGPYSDELGSLLTREQVLEGWVDGKDVRSTKLRPDEREVTTKLISMYSRLGYDELEIFASRVFWEVSGAQIVERPAKVELSHQVELPSQKDDLAEIVTSHWQPLQPSVDRVITALSGKYSDVEVWRAEMPVIRDTLSAISNKLGNDFVLQKGLGHGSSGITVLVIDNSLKDIRGNGLPVVLKLPRPKNGKFSVTNLEIVSGEIATLCSLNHENIVRVLRANHSVVGSVRIPWYLMEYIENCQTLQEFVDDKPKAADLVSVLLDVSMGLTYLHGQKIVHCDIKPENILVKRSGPYRGYVGDLGYAHLIADDPREILVRFTPRTAHHYLIENMIKESDPDAATAKIPRNKLTTDLDRYALGKTLLQVLDHIEEADILDNFQLRYFKQIILKLLGGQPETKTLIHAVPKSVIRSITYQSTQQLVNDWTRFDA